MKWITRERVKVDRVACPWRIKKFIEPEGEFLFVPADEVMALAEGFRYLGLKDDQEINTAQRIVYDALYSYCQEMIRRGTPDGMFR